MSVPAYPDYKDSGVAWLGAIPAGWFVERFRWVFRESPEKIESEVVGPMLSVSGYRGIEIKDYDDENRRRLDADLIGYRIVRPGQLVVNTMWLNYAGLGVSEHEGHVSPAYRSYWIERDVERRYIHHMMRSSIYVQGYTRLLTGIRPNSLQMSRDDLMDFPVLLPPRAEQTAIAAFLDRETAKIDALVAEQEQLIALLKEKRQAVISHAVTKGLNTEAPMKDSGIEWLGEIPAHWIVAKLFHGARLQSGYAFASADFGSDGIPVVRMNNLNRGKLDLSESVRIPETAINSTVALSQGDIVWGMSGSIGETGSLGNFAVVSAEDIPSQLNQRVGRFILNPARMNAKFLEIWIQSYPFCQQILLAVTGTAQFNVSAEQVQSTMIAFPALNEQQQITERVTSIMGGFEGLISEVQSALSLLQERRAALISAAVTGKIDVRGLVNVLTELEPA